MFLLSADPLNNKVCMPCFQLTSMFVRNISHYIEKAKLKEGISSLVVKKVS
jgi:hypothetical protein